MSTPDGSPKKSENSKEKPTPEKSRRNLLKRQIVKTVEPKKQYGFYVLESNICIEDEILKNYIFEQWDNYFDDNRGDIVRIYKIGTVKNGFKNRYQNPTLSFLPPHLAGWHCVAWFGVNNKEDYKTIKEIEKRFKTSHNAYLKGKGVGQTEMIFNLSVDEHIVPLCKEALDEKNIDYEYIGKAFFSGRNQDKRLKTEKDAIIALDGLRLKQSESLKF